LSPFLLLNIIGKPRSKSINPIIGTNIRMEFSVMVIINGITNMTEPDTIKIIPILLCSNKLLYFICCIKQYLIFDRKEKELY
jgi:hypothetical protein